MPWWAWLTVGAILLVAELSFVDFQFYLVFLGVSALLVGIADLGGLALPYWLQWLAFAALSLGSLFWFRERVFARLRPPPEGEIPEGVEGEQARATETIAPGAMGSVRLRGTSWSARNDGELPIPAGTLCQVDHSDGTLLSVYAQD